MTDVTLFDTGAALPGDFLIHRKMHHEVAGRRLVALMVTLMAGTRSLFLSLRSERADRREMATES